MIYEGVRHRYKKVITPREIQPWEDSCIGAFQGLVNGLVLTPIDTIRSRIMLQGAGGAVGGKTRKEAVGKSEGVVQVWMALRGAVFFTALELAKKTLGVSSS
ncbi:hypothetical protein GUITHDRAFT_121538 [Guillardia theta CCMP2712]|uniref:Uncharacterized protein n=1 Tax=Guillardia theta (strain CCMP2712) TaxID=905079 RepID=L1I7T3_GUITC|nr:hypothetical protein GUITHDRAFT_121538 [Guillardia theta CCMP2712]EKX32306.1 hypothetical protein GUITHDRAFT_121538 [Guillardia theta CCMP2712]|eukprot:XP_005819286.1 hypothetical protein GUITHDRAFT_121538 [Guillardia theta CCMP2712]